jgi:hypothetical protein
MVNAVSMQAKRLAADNALHDARSNGTSTADSAGSDGNTVGSVLLMSMGTTPLYKLIISAPTSENGTDARNGSGSKEFERGARIIQRPKDIFNSIVFILHLSCPTIPPFQDGLQIVLSCTYQNCL